jgi:hypothetical protein
MPTPPWGQVLLFDFTGRRRFLATLEMTERQKRRRFLTSFGMTGKGVSFRACDYPLCHSEPAEGRRGISCVMNAEK